MLDSIYYIYCYTFILRHYKHNFFQVLDDYSEVQSTLARSVSQDESLEEFEAELDGLLAEEEKGAKRAPSRGKESPPRVNDDEILKRLAALRTPPEGGLLWVFVNFWGSITWICVFML